MISCKTSFAVALGITGFVGWALFAEEPSDCALPRGNPPYSNGCHLPASQMDFPRSRTAEEQRNRICTPGFAASIRPPKEVTEHIKLKMLRERGVPPWYSYLWRLDHIIPLELDGDPLAPENLQLQRVDESLEKDKQENAARASYCAGEMSLNEAQGLFHRSEP